MRILLIAYDNGSYINWFPQGLAYLAAALRANGCDVEIYKQDIHHYPDEHLTDYLNQNRFDVVGLGVIAGYYQYRKMLAIADAINSSTQRPFFILGGHGPSPEPEFFLRRTNADAIVIGEGEITIVEMVAAFADKRSLDGIKGVAYRNGDQIIINERRPLIENVDALPLPNYDLFCMEYYRLFRMPHADNSDFVMHVLSGRGCPFKCSFCYRMDPGFRPRSSEGIIEEISILQKKYGITYIAFTDELLMSSIERTVDLCEAFLKSRLKFKWYCNGRLNYAKPDVIRLMKEAGCVFINYGIEALDDNVLKLMNKSLTYKQIVRGIEATLAEGISPGFNVIFGNLGDNTETLEKAVDFLVKYDDGSQMRTIRPVTPYPGSQLYYHAIAQGMLKDCEDFYEHKHLNSDLLTVNFTNLTDNEFYKALFKANKRLLRNYHKKKSASSIDTAYDLYINRNDSFRGFRQG